jgi:hypothetical protein
MYTLFGMLIGYLKISQVEALKNAAQSDFRKDLSPNGRIASPLKIWQRNLCERLDKDLVLFLVQLTLFWEMFFCLFFPS